MKVHFYVKRNVVRFNGYILHGFLVQYLTLLTLIYSTIYNVYLWSMHLDLGFARPVVSLHKDKGGSTSEDDVILLYLDWCLIT